tara:strand:- start:733 stop:993 length:261 start_codon:yes stop_codon:yes gene_type:complete
MKKKRIYGLCKINANDRRFLDYCHKSGVYRHYAAFGNHRTGVLGALWRKIGDAFGLDWDVARLKFWRLIEREQRLHIQSMRSFVPH